MVEIHRQARIIRLFRATDVLGQGLANSWVATAGYVGATVLVKKALDQERLISAEQDPQGVLVMNIHKSKGKEFDGVVLVEGAFKSFFSTIEGRSRHIRIAAVYFAWRSREPERVSLSLGLPVRPRYAMAEASFGDHRLGWCA